MKKILFVCHGNICRSPMAESIFMDLVRRQGLSEALHAESAAATREEIGNPIYPQAQTELRRQGVPVIPHRARQLTRADYDRFDLIIGMDRWNIGGILRIVGGDPENKVRLLMSYTDRPGDVADPWYSDRFDEAFRDIFEGCQALIRHLLHERN